MSKKTSSKYISNGERNSVRKSLLNVIKAERSVVEKSCIKQDAWVKGKNPWLTIENPDSNQTNKKYIRVKAENYWGLYNPKPKKNDNKNLY
jgi:hypothetical protein